MNLRHALEYLQSGFSIIPLRGPKYARGSSDEEKSGDAKAPLIPWTEFRRRKPTEDEVRSWFERWPEANIGIVTGEISGVVVVDFDSEEAIEWARREGLLETALVSTGKGIHAYYLYPSGKKIGNSVDLNGMKIDIRGEGGYAVAPPSIHPSGSVYKWIRKMNLAPFPSVFLNGSKTGRTATDLRPLYRGVRRGTRNDALARLCGSWVRDGLSLEECLDMARTWNMRNDPPLDDVEVERTVRSIFQRDSAHNPLERYLFHEKNLLRLPLFVHARDRIHRVEPIVWTEEKPSMKREWTVIPSTLGLPGPFDEDVFMAINRILSEKPQPITNPVDMGSLSEIAQIIGYNDSGRNLALIKESIMRISSLTLKSKSVFYDAGKGRFVTIVFHVIDRAFFTGDTGEDGETVRTTLLWFNPVYLNNINAGYVSSIDYGKYFSLRTYLARGIYRILAPLANSSVPVTLTYRTLAGKLQIEVERFLSCIRRQLDRAHRELLEAGIIRTVTFRVRKDTVLISYSLNRD
jgi:hypothetical protein